MDHRRDPRTHSTASSFAARRRTAALARQRAARGDAMNAARAARLAEGGGGEGVDAAALAYTPPPPLDSQHSSPSSRADAGWRTLTLHEWLIDTPSSLSSDWLVAPRPEGVRVVLTARGGRTVARSRSGARLLTCASRLPGGGGGGGHEGAHAGCVLDCVFQPDGGGGGGGSASASPPSPAGGTFFVLDVLEWGGRDLEACTAEFRTFWTATQLAECGAATAPPVRGDGAPPPASVVPLPFAPATPSALTAAARARTPFHRDGILLLHRDGAYVAGAPNPLALAWKDGACSRHVVDTDPSTRLPATTLAAVLRVTGDASALETGDDPPVRVAAVPAGAEGAPPGRLVRVAAAGGATVDAATGAAALHGVTPALGPPPRGRAGRADTLSKLLFQSAARAGCGVALEALVASAESGEMNE